MSIHDRPAAELYGEIYRDHPAYGMSGRVRKQLEAFLHRNRVSIKEKVKSACDVGCGRGESFDVLRGAGVETVVGMEVVPALCERPDVTQISTIWNAHREAIGADLVTCMDVLEHVPEEFAHNSIDALIESARICVYIQIATSLDVWGPKVYGEHLHITVKPHRWWIDRVTEALGDGDVFTTRAENGACEFEIWVGGGGLKF